MLKAADEKPGTVWQRVSNSSTSDFFYFFFFTGAITRNDLIFYESSAMKSEKVTTGKQFIDANGEVFHDFMQEVLLATNDVRGKKKKKLSVTRVIAVTLPQLEINKLLHSAGICWHLDLFGRVSVTGLSVRCLPVSLIHSTSSPLALK